MNPESFIKLGVCEPALIC